MKALFLIQDSEGPGAKFRVLQYLPYLKQRGIVPEVESMPRGLRKRLKLFRSAKEFHLVFVQKRLLQSWQLRYLRRRARKIIYDFDDAVMYKDSNSPIQTSRSREKQFKQMVETADLVIAGNEYLRREALKYTQDVSILPTPINMARYSPKNYLSQSDELAPLPFPLPLEERIKACPALDAGVRGKRKLCHQITLGWVGSKSTLTYLKDLIPVLRSLAERFNNIQLKIVGNDFFDCPPLPVIKKPWRDEEENSDLQGFDIGLSPLRDDIWSRGKCGFKVLQYMAMRLPVVSSPVGANAEMVQDGVNGFLATSEEKWIEKLCLLIENADLRRRMGTEGRQRVERFYSLEVNAPKLLNVLMTWQNI